MYDELNSSDKKDRSSDPQWWWIALVTGFIGIIISVFDLWKQSESYDYFWRLAKRELNKTHSWFGPSTASFESDTLIASLSLNEATNALFANLTAIETRLDSLNQALQVDSVIVDTSKNIDTKTPETDIDGIVVNYEDFYEIWGSAWWEYPVSIDLYRLNDAVYGNTSFVSDLKDSTRSITNRLSDFESRLQTLLNRISITKSELKSLDEF